MKPIVLVLMCAGTGAIASTIPASAAPPAYCALYAREYAASRIGAPSDSNEVTAIERLQDQAYFRCLNQDVEPPFPETSAYFGASLGDIAGDTSGGIGEGDVSGDDEPVIDNPAPDVTASAAPDPGPAADVTATWSKKRIAWCRAHYPNSFDEKTGMVLTLDHVQKLCP